MHKNKIIQVLKSLSPKELREADKFVRSPIHNRHEQVAVLFQYLRKHLNGSEKAFDRERIFKHLFPNETFDMQKVHHVSSYLLKVLEEYLSWSEWRKDESNYGLYLMRAYSGHKLEGQFTTTLSKTKKSLENNFRRDAHFHQLHYQFQFEEYNFARRQGRTRDFNLQQLADSQDIAFLVEKLKNACLLLSHQAVTKKNYDQSFLEVILEFLQGNKLLNTPAIAMYYHGLLALSDIQNEQSFLELKKLLVEEEGTFEISELRDLFILAINYCIRRLNMDDQSYLREVFDIYQAGLKIDVFLDNGELSPWTFNNIAQSGLRLKEFEVVEEFILQYNSFLPNDQRDNCFNLNFAWLHYGKKNYRDAMQLLLQMDLRKDILMACGVRTLFARMYYELNEYDTLASHLQSFKTFIKRKKALAYHRAPYLHFIQYLQKISQGKFNGKQTKENLAKEINETKVAAKEWLLEQLNN